MFIDFLSFSRGSLSIAWVAWRRESQSDLTNSSGDWTGTGWRGEKFLRPSNLMWYVWVMIVLPQCTIATGYNPFIASWQPTLL